MAIGYAGDATVRRRGGAGAAAILVHAALLLLILWGRGTPPDPAPSSPALSVFDVAPPPPPPRAAPVPPPPLPPPPDRLTLRDGGSPDRAPPSAPAPYDAPARTADLMAEPLPAQAPQGQIPLPGLAGAAPSTGAGAGSADGEGGRGRGDGTGTGDGRTGLARALWISMPSPRDLDRHWPERARRERIAGRVLLACIVPRPGPPRRCRVVDEHPRNLGFGAAAMRLSGMFRIRPVTRGAEVQKLPVIVPIDFAVPIEIKLPTTASN